MSAFLQVSRYIYKNNPWYSLPWKFLSAILYQFQKRTSSKLPIKKLFNGKQSYLFPKNPVSSALIYAPIPDKDEIFALRQFANSDTIFLDIGANVGMYSLFLADCVKEVFAFEPHPETAKCCKRNFALNNISENKVIEKAVSDSDEPKYFSNQSAASPINHIVNKRDNAITVLATTLDSFIESQNFSKDTPFILKIDVEGFEHEVFLGAKRFLKESNIKAIIFESFSPNITEIVKLLQENGFHTSAIGDNNMLAFKGVV